MNRLRPEDIGICEKLEQHTLYNIFERLFLKAMEPRRELGGGYLDQEQIPVVTEEEIEYINKRAIVTSQ